MSGRRPSRPVLTISASLQRGRFHLLPGGPGTARVRHRSPPAHSARPPPSRRGRTSRNPRRPVSRARPAPAADLGHLLTHDDEPPTDQRHLHVPVEPADPFTEAIRTALEIGAAVVFTDPDPASAPICPTPIPIPTRSPLSPCEQYVEAYRVYPARPNAGSRAVRRRHRLEAAGRRSLARTLVVVSLNLLDPVLDAMEAPQDEPSRRRREEYICSTRIPIVWAKSLRISVSQARYESFRGGDDGFRRRSTADAVQFDVFREAEKPMK